MNDAIRILLVDDHPVVRSGLAAVLDATPGLAVVGQAGDGAEGVQRHRELVPDVTVMDLAMPGTGGVEAMRRIREDSPGARFVALTVFLGEEDIFRAFEAGASAYVLKEAPIDEIISVIRLVHAGGDRVPRQVADRLAGRNTLPGLSDRELQVLELVALGLSNEEIGERLGIVIRTVKSHLEGIMAKLGVDSRTRAVRVALERGIVHAPGPNPKPR